VIFSRFTPSGHGFIVLFSFILTVSLSPTSKSYGSSIPASQLQEKQTDKNHMQKKNMQDENRTQSPNGDKTPRNGKAAYVSENMSDLLGKLINEGLVNIKDIDETILVDLKYASAQNFMGTNVYGDLKDCYLRKEAAVKLRRANDLLKKTHPDLRILVGDGFRPRRVQRRMWEIVKGTPMRPYVANPAAGSMHNYGMAVDVTIADARGNRLDMGCPMDSFGIISHPCEESRLLRDGRLTETQVANRKLLREVMTKAGFQTLSIEWWHFNACDRKTAAGKYKIID
jgi:D-alanyl-D-alanine dipeptidase